MREVEARSSDLSDMLKQLGSICEELTICYGRNKRTGLQVLLGSLLQREY